jgi:serine/threonine protein kinase
MLPSGWGDLTEEARDLIGKMMEKDPAKRIRAADALHHPFIVHHRTPVSSPARGMSRDSPGGPSLRLLETQ